MKSIEWFLMWIWRNNMIFWFTNKMSNVAIYASKECVKLVKLHFYELAIHLKYFFSMFAFGFVSTLDYWVPNYTYICYCTYQPCLRDSMIYWLRATHVIIHVSNLHMMHVSPKHIIHNTNNIQLHSLQKKISQLIPYLFAFHVYLTLHCIIIMFVMLM